MQPDKQDEIKGWLSMANESLSDAMESLNSNMLKVAQNRLYYSLFYAVKALALREKFITSKHTELIGWFNREFIKTGVFSKEMGKLCKEAYENRDKSDYTINFKPDKEELKQDLETARLFIEEINKYIEAKEAES